MMVLGFVLHMLNIIDDVFASKLNKFVFSITLPVLLFHQLGTTDFLDAWDGRFVLFCFVVTAVTILLVWLISSGIHSLPERGEFVQAAYRSSAAILTTQQKPLLCITHNRKVLEMQDIFMPPASNNAFQSLLRTHITLSQRINLRLRGHLDRDTDHTGE